MMNKIERDVKILKTYAIFSTLVLIFVLLTAFQVGGKKGEFDEINVQRINIIDSEGKNVIVISNRDKFPNPIIAGKEYPRSIKPSGIVFYDEQGTECGGIAVATLPVGRRTLIVLDYSNTEAIGFSVWEAKDGNYSAGFAIQDRNPLDADIMKVGTEGTNRVSIENDNKNAEISLSDANGNKRIRLRVDSTGIAKIEILDEKGKPIYTLPSN